MKVAAVRKQEFFHAISHANIFSTNFFPQNAKMYMGRCRRDDVVANAILLQKILLLDFYGITNKLQSTFPLIFGCFFEGWAKEEFWEEFRLTFWRLLALCSLCIYLCIYQ